MRRNLQLITILGLAAVVGSCVYTYRLEVEDPERTWDATGLTALEAVTRNGSIELAADFGSTVRLNVTRV